MSRGPTASPMRGGSRTRSTTGGRPARTACIDRAERRPPSLTSENPVLRTHNPNKRPQEALASAAQIHKMPAIATKPASGRDCAMPLESRARRPSVDHRADSARSSGRPSSHQALQRGLPPAAEGSLTTREETCRAIPGRRFMRGELEGCPRVSPDAKGARSTPWAALCVDTRSIDRRVCRSRVFSGPNRAR
jgi:hypothetical protein